MRMLRMMTGLAARLAVRLTMKPGRGSENDGLVADAPGAVGAEVPLGGCYHDAVAYSLGYDAQGVVELCGETFTNLGGGGGAMAALRRHRQNYDPSKDIERFIVALKPVKIISSRKKDGDAIEAYGFPPGPIAGNPITFARCEKTDHPTHFFTTVPFSFGRLVADGEACGHPGCLSHVSHPCEGCGRVAGMAPPNKSAKKACDECSCPYCECDGSCDPDYATSCHRCDTWVCAYCVVEGACHNCFQKMQGGVTC